MQEITKKFGLYDHWGYIITGLYQICVMYIPYCLVAGVEIRSILGIFKIENSIALLLGSYLVGHLVQAISNIFDKWESRKKNEKNKNFAFVVEKGRKFFDLPLELSDREVWQYCYLYALSNDFSGHVLLFNSMHSLYRGFWVASGLGFLFGAAVTIIQLVSFAIDKFFTKTGNYNFPSWTLIVFIGITFVFYVLFNRRKKRFFEYMGEKTLITFDILSKKLIN